MLQIPYTVQARKSTELTSQGTQTKLGMRSWRANSHKVDVKPWKYFSNINSSLLAYVRYLMYVSQDSRQQDWHAATNMCLALFKYWHTEWNSKYKVKNSMSVLASSILLEAESERHFVVAKGNISFTQGLKGMQDVHYVCYWRNTLYMQSWMSRQVPKHLIDSPPVCISFVQTWSCRDTGQVMKSIFIVIVPTYKWVNN